MNGYEKEIQCIRKQKALLVNGLKFYIGEWGWDWPTWRPFTYLARAHYACA
jgi:hypothetical protein